MTTLGIVGGGQLARMLALAARPLGVSCVVLDPAENPPAASVAKHLRAEFTDAEGLTNLASACDVVTFEFENISASSLQSLSDAYKVFPPVSALSVSQDRLLEKQHFVSLNIPTTRFIPVDDFAGLQAALLQVGLPAVLKTRRLGYDGKGQVVIHTQSDAASAWQTLAQQPALLENWVPFERELSVIGVRNGHGEVRVYPLIENHHQKGILHLSRAPAPASTTLFTEAMAYIERLLNSFSYVGVLTLELFESQGKLIANEMAPRVHNSGHWTIEGAECSQFEQHVRAVLGLPLGSVQPQGLSAMVNLIGHMPQAKSVLQVPGAHLHDYEKAARPGRKLGHINVTAKDQDTLEQRLRPILQTVANVEAGIE